MFETSPETEKLDAAIAKAQGQIRSAKKDAENPAYKSKYADLASIIDACREALAHAEISYTQWLITSAEPGKVQLVTRLAHAGQWMRATMTVPVAQQTPQGYGSAWTYAKRYALSAALGIAAEEDDDGNEASGLTQRGQGQQRRQPEQQQQQQRQQRRNQAPPLENGYQQKGGPNLDEALRQIAAGKTAAEVDQTLAVLRPLKWTADEARVIKGAAEDRKKTIAGSATKPGTTELLESCEHCGTRDDAKHTPNCPGLDRAALPEREYGTEG